jgi:hypothetical protein
MEEYKMENNKPPEITEGSIEEYTPWQKGVLTLLQWGAWGTAFMAIAMIMHS